MSVLGALFVATDESALKFDSTRWPASELYVGGGLLPMHLELLWAVLQAREWDGDLAVEFEPIGDFDGEEAWMIRFPADLVTRLAAATPGELDAARVEWANLEELGVDPSDLTELMVALQRLAKLAVSTGRSVYLYGSL